METILIYLKDNEEDLLNYVSVISKSVKINYGSLLRYEYGIYKYLDKLEYMRYKNMIDFYTLTKKNLNWSNIKYHDLDNIVELSNFKLLNMLSPYIGAFENLKILNLSNNLLSNLPYQIINLKNLVNLDISFNNFKVIPQIIYNLWYYFKIIK